MENCYGTVEHYDRTLEHCDRTKENSNEIREIHDGAMEYCNGTMEHCVKKWSNGTVIEQSIMMTEWSTMVT